jgi:hypothetical protein
MSHHNARIEVMKRKPVGDPTQPPPKYQETEETEETQLQQTSIPLAQQDASGTPAQPPPTSQTITQNPIEIVSTTTPTVPPLVMTPQPILQPSSQPGGTPPPSLLAQMNPTVSKSPISFSLLSKKASNPVLKPPASIFSQQGDDETPTTAPKPIQSTSSVKKKTSTDTLQKKKEKKEKEEATDFDYDAFFTKEKPSDKPSSSIPVKKVTWVTEATVNYTGRTTKPGGTSWSIVEPRPSEWCLITNNRITIPIEKELTVNAVRKYVGTLIGNGMVPSTITHVEIA